MSLNSEYQGDDKLIVGNGDKLLISHIGYPVLSTYDPHKQIRLNYILCVPNITENLLEFLNYYMTMILMLSFKNLFVSSRTRAKGKFW